MNRTLLFANAVALAVLLGFHFVPENNEAVAQRMPHYLQVQKAPQWAVLSDQSRATAQAVNDPELVLPAHDSERLVF
jgi:hypothetical protein